MSKIEAKLISDQIRCRLKDKLTTLGLKPRLVVILVGNNAASVIYVRNKRLAAEKIGIELRVLSLSVSVSEAELLKNITALNVDPLVNGILVQLPLPDHIDELKVINNINPIKDLDCFNVSNIGKLVSGQNSIRPCTPNGCLYLIKHVLGDDLAGLDAVVIGRSNIVGKPMSSMLINEGVTVTVLHSRSIAVDDRCRLADIIVVATGKPKLVKSSWVSCKSVVIDVGINKDPDSGKIAGDVDYDNVHSKVRAITPVPGGVGPMTVTFLLVNAVLLTAWQSGKDIGYSYLL